MDIKKQFVKQYSYLACDVASKKRLENIASQVTKIRLSKKKGQQGYTIVDFDNDLRLLAAKPETTQGLKIWPSKLHYLFKKHAYLMFGEKWGSYDVSSDISLGATTFSAEYVVGQSRIFPAGCKEEDIRCIIDLESDWWLLHPTRKLKNGEPALVFCSHEGAGVKKTTSLSAAALFLQHMLEIINAGKERKEEVEKQKALPPLPKLTKEQKEEVRDIYNVAEGHFSAVYSVYKHKKPCTPKNRQLVQDYEAFSQRYHDLCYQRQPNNAYRDHFTSDFVQVDKWVKSIERRWKK